MPKSKLNAGLTILLAYRDLNLTAFRKSLKKFQKRTRIRAQEAYLSERISSQHFASSRTIESLMEHTEGLYSSVFEARDAKAARARLRMRGGQKSERPHHFGTFRSGLFIGFAIPLIVVGALEAGESSMHERVPAWKALLQVYGAMLVPVLFAMLFGLNLYGWKRARINAVYIFDFDVPTVLDPCQFLELPAFLFCLLAGCWYASFAHFFLNNSKVGPTSWPAIWLAFCVVFMLNPLDMAFRSTRVWFVTTTLRTISGGILSPGFRDSFLGDELNSLSYSFYNLSYMACAFGNGWKAETQSVCRANTHFYTPLTAVIPALIRMTQCLRRFRDSEYKGKIHLVNCGKSASTIMQYWNVLLLDERRAQA